MIQEDFMSDIPLLTKNMDMTLEFFSHKKQVYLS